MDRLTGDTILAHFDTVAATDTARKPRIRQLVAIANPGSLATSLQHLPPRDSSLCIPATNYVRGRRITVSFDSAKVSTVTVNDQAGGIYVEPNPDSTARCNRGAPVTTTAGPTAGRAPTGTPPGTPPGTPAPTPTSPPPTVPVATPAAPAPKRP
jgi:hypothetical protein